VANVAINVTPEALAEPRPMARQWPWLLTPSKVTAWLDCAHYLTLKHRVEAGTFEATNGGVGEFARLLMDKGLEHERACLEEYQRSGKTMLIVPDRAEKERFQDWVDRVGDVMAEGYDVIYQLPFVHGGMRGIADFLVKHTFDDGTFTYEPLDAKLARKEAKPGHILQLCFYADAIEAAGRAAPHNVHVWLGSGRPESIRLAEVRAYWRRIQGQLAMAMNPAPDAPPTEPVKCMHCVYCEFADACEAVWREADSLQFVAGVRCAETDKLQADDVTTMLGLATCDREVASLQPARRARLVSQAALQVQARQMDDGSMPPFHPLPDPTPEEVAAGFAALPQPSDGDVFLDYEGHPFWRADTGLFFLFGLLTKGAGGEWTYEQRWAHSKQEEATQAKALVEYFAARREAFPDMHVYHYNHTERSALVAMLNEHGIEPGLLDELINSGLFVDLLPIVRNSLQAGVESYGLKAMEQLARYERGHDIDKGAGAVVEYDRWTHAKDGDTLDRIATYNMDDVRATLALRDWLIGQRDDDLAWRSATFTTEVTEKRRELDDLIESLHGEDRPAATHLMGDLLGYWGREGAVNTAHLLAKLAQDTGDLMDDQAAIAGLNSGTEIALFTPTGKVAKHPGMELRFPPQPTAPGFAPGGQWPPKVCFSGADEVAGWAEVLEFDAQQGRILLKWTTRSRELGVIPGQLVLNEYIGPGVKTGALLDLGTSVDASTAPDSAQTAILEAAAPRFNGTGAGPAGGVFTDDVNDVMRWVLDLDRSCVPIQGPPGTGKTWMGAQIVMALVKAGKRVGITAMSHAAIDNMLCEVLEVFTANGCVDQLRVARAGAKDSTPDHAAIHRVENKDAAAAEFNVVAGTTWAFASKALRGSPVDVLIVDEAGQLGIADALAASGAAGSVVLLGDPLQLPQVAQASHPGRSGVSVLEHMLGEGVATVPPDHGVFLTTTRRMHPDVCEFISQEIYEGRLSAHESCAVQRTDHGTGLRWLQAHHADRTTESIEEAELVAEEIRRLLGSKWTDSDGSERDLTVADFMVVAPYNDQVRMMRRVFDADPTLAGVRVGTVDKFQGQQAPVVFFTMTTSTAEDMPRGPDFLFSRNRLNVALSRAKCLAYVVCTDELLNSRAKSVEEMKLISTLCAAVDYALI